MRQIGIALVMLLLIASAVPAQTTVKGDPRAWEELKAAMGRLGELRTHRMRFSLAPGQAPEGFDMSMVTEVVSPDRSKMTMRQADIAIMEVVVVGQQMRRRTTLLPRGQQMYDMQRSAFNQAFGGGIGGIIGWITNPVGMALNFAISQIASRMAQQATGEEPGKWKCTQLAQSGGGSQQQSQSDAEITVTKLADGTVEGARTQVYEMAFTERGRASGKGRLHVLADRGIPRRMEMLDDSGKVLGHMDWYDIGAAITIELPPCEQ